MNPGLSGSRHLLLHQYSVFLSLILNEKLMVLLSKTSRRTEGEAHLKRKMTVILNLM